MLNRVKTTDYIMALKQGHTVSEPGEAQRYVILNAFCSEH